MKLSDILGVVGENMRNGLLYKGSFNGDIDTLSGKSAIGIYTITNDVYAPYITELYVIGRSGNDNHTIQIMTRIPPAPPSNDDKIVISYRWGHAGNWGAWYRNSFSKSGYNLGAACAKGVATTVASGNTDLITSGAVYTALQNAGGVDYEEGTWSGQGYLDNTAVTSMSINQAKYIKIGNVGFIWCTVDQNSPSPGSTINRISGLPFSFDSIMCNNQMPHGFCTFSQAGSTTYSLIPVQLRGTEIKMIGSGYGAGAGLSYSGIFATGLIKP